MNGDAYKYIRYNPTQETRWATVEEMRASSSYINLNDETYPAAGLPILSDGKEAYVDNLDTHSLIFGATGSKKTRLFCMPMINMFINAGESFIATDPKGELYAQSSGLAKAKGYKMVVLNFRDIGYGDKWNPLSLPYEYWKSGDVDEAGMLLSDIAYTFAAPMIKNTKDSYWPEAAQQLAIAALYTVLAAAKPEEVNMKSFAQLVSFGNMDNIKELTDMMEEGSIPQMNFKSTVCTEARITASSIVASLFGMLRMFCSNEKLADMLSETTFDTSRFGKEKTAVYLIVPDEKTTYHALITMFIKQTYEVLIAEAQKTATRTLPVRVNFVLDEFCNIPMIPDMPSMISAARSRNMRYYLVVQSLHQLRGRYGEDADTIKGNCDNWVFLTTKEKDLLEEISSLCGTVKTATGDSRPLVSVSELQRFSKERGEALIMHARQYPFLSALADISQYKMFGTYESVPFAVQNRESVKSFSLQRFLEMIEKGTAIAPFASFRHKLEQAQKIYREGIRTTVPTGSANEADPLAALKQRLEERKNGKKPNAAAATPAEATGLTPEQIVIRDRIAALTGIAFANRFFAEKLYNVSLRDASDYED